MSNTPKTTAKAWLHMLAQGRCTCTELAEAVGTTRKAMENLLFHMVNRQYAHRYLADTRKNGTAYGVTVTCKVPGGVPLADILFAMKAQPEPPTMTIPQDRMKAAPIPGWKPAMEDDPRIPRVVPGWKPPVMQCVRGGL